jgi:2-iminobutanoate/2-iminopropanoate deaminase
MRKIIETKKAPKPEGRYSQAINVDKFLFVSGQVAIDPKEGRIIANGIKKQTAQVMKNIKAILQASGYNFSNVVRSNVYLSSKAQFSEFNSEYAKYFYKGFPTRATVGTELIPDALLEISMVAYKE